MPRVSAGLAEFAQINHFVNRRRQRPAARFAASSPPPWPGGCQAASAVAIDIRPFGILPPGIVAVKRIFQNQFAVRFVLGARPIRRNPICVAIGMLHVLVHCFSVPAQRTAVNDQLAAEIAFAPPWSSAIAAAVAAGGKAAPAWNGVAGEIIGRATFRKSSCRTGAWVGSIATAMESSLSATPLKVPRVGGTSA